MIKIAVVSMVWKRPEIFELFAQGIKAWVIPPDFKLSVFIAGSEGRTSRAMVEKHGFQYLEAPNQPLAQKANRSISMAKGHDYVICMGSDDILHPDTFTTYCNIMRKGVDFIGVQDFYFYDTTTGKASYWGGYKEPYRIGRTCGAGRVLSKRILDLWKWHVWEVKHNHILDNSMDEKLKHMEHKSCIFKLKDYDLFAADVKSTTNMTPFELWPNSKYINPKILTDKFPYLCAE
jgi:glycosyltransferase involved in cell wall biosynthesis